MKVLLLENNTTHRECLDILLSAEKFYVKAVATAQEGRESLAEGSPPDAVVLDYYLTDTTGVSFLRELRKNAITRNVPAIIVTAAAQEKVEEIEAEVQNIGPVKILRKPVESKQVVNAIRAMVPAGAVAGGV